MVTFSSRATSPTKLGFVTFFCTVRTINAKYGIAMRYVPSPKTILTNHNYWSMRLIKKYICPTALIHFFNSFEWKKLLFLPHRECIRNLRLGLPLQHFFNRIEVWNSPFANWDLFGRSYSFPGNSNLTFTCSEAEDFFAFEVAEAKISSLNINSSSCATKLSRGLRT